MTKGWCPVHDRVVDSRTGVCPECGTPLVDLTAQPREAGEERFVVEEDPPDEEPVVVATAPETRLWPDIRLPQRLFGRDTVSVGPAAIAAIVAVAVVASFLVGWTIPRGSARDDARDAPAVRAQFAVGIQRDAAGVGLRLESFSQRGTRVTVRASVDEASAILIGRIQSIDVVPIIEGDAAEPSTMNLETRTTVDRTRTIGFIAEGNLGIAPSARVGGIRIEALYLSAKDGVDFPVDLSTVAPSASGAPRVKAVRSPTRRAGVRDYQLTDVVGWPDRLEVRVHLGATREGWIPDEMYTLIQPNSNPVDASMIEYSSDSVFTHLAFRIDPPWSERSIVRVTIRGLVVSGMWSWLFA